MWCFILEDWSWTQLEYDNRNYMILAGFLIYFKTVKHSGTIHTIKYCSIRTIPKSWDNFEIMGQSWHFSKDIDNILGQSQHHGTVPTYWDSPNILGQSHYPETVPISWDSPNILGQFQHPGIVLTSGDSPNIQGQSQHPGTAPTF